MSTATGELEQNGPPAGPPPWLDDTMQQRMEWRDGDIVVSVPAKSGTTWTMNIVHQLRSGGDPAFADIYAEVPWPEFLPGPERVPDDLVAAFDAMPHDRRRAFKSHAAPPVLPFHAAGSGLDVRYVVVVRNPDEALASFYPFLAAHSDAWYDLWNVDRDQLLGPDFEAFFAGLGSHALAPMVFGVTAAWWPLRDEPNVMLVHYSDLKVEPEATIRTLADFLDFEVTEAQWPAILEYTSFSWMKAHEDKFELRTIGDAPLLDPGAMIRTGRIGASAEDGVTPEMSAAMAEIGRGILTDPAAFDWCYNGRP